MVFTEDLIHIYVDFLPITATTSSDDALALLISMYTIFELNFPKNSRTVRLLYSMFHEEKRFLTNTIRLFLKEKKIEIADGSRHNRSLVSVSAENETPANPASSQSSTQREKANELTITSTDNLSVDDPLTTMIISQATGDSPISDNQ